MARVSPSASWNRSAEPNLEVLPDDAFLKRVSIADKSDNKTLSSLASASKDCWRLVDVDSLRCFFHAAKTAIMHASIEDKNIVLAALVEWLPKVSDQLPNETRNQMWRDLIVITNAAEFKPQEKLIISTNILESVKPLYEKELQIFSAFTMDLEERDRFSLTELSVLVQQAVNGYSTAVELMSTHINNENQKLMEVISKN
jgi:hypothetical protein